MCEERDVVAIDGGVGTGLVAELIVVLQLSIHVVLLGEGAVVVERAVEDAAAYPCVVARGGAHV